MITYRATLDVPVQTVAVVSAWLLAHRKAHDARPWQRAATPYVQAVMVLRWFKEATDLPVLARDAKISIATAYRYLHEAIEVIAARAPDLHEVVTAGLEQGWAFVCLDGTLIPSTRSGERSAAGHDLWYSGKHKRHGGNIQVLTGPTGYPEWVSEVEPGSTHDITAARHHVLGAFVPGRRTRTANADRQGLHRRRHRHPRPHQGPRPRDRQPDPQQDDQRAPRPRRTRQRLAQTHLESTRTDHPRPLAHRRHHRRRARPTPPSATDPVRKPHCGRSFAGGSAGIPFFRFVGGDGQEGVGEHREGDVAVPGVVFADLVFVETDLVLA